VYLETLLPPQRLFVLARRRCQAGRDHGGAARLACDGGRWARATGAGGAFPEAERVVRFNPRLNWRFGRTMLLS